MTVKIYNSMTRTKEEFKPQIPGQVRMYVCGPTVYDYIHIGNARPLIFFDVVRRYFLWRGYDVRYVVNFTDVDDKLIKKAEETGETVPQVADRFIQAYFEDAKALGIRNADVHPRVTEHLPDIIRFIEGLVEKGYAYERGGDVFFRTGKFADYGKLSGQNLEELQYGIRVEVDERKENPQDFVLWKKAKPGEISWMSPWGDGRPGWHIECSTMAQKYLGETLDIHGGGQDLQFPHHECEVAQSEALHGKPLANYWMHNGYIHINNEKMSKSLGNGVLVREILKRIRPRVLRFFMLSTHYRNPLHFSEEALKQAQGAVERIENCWANLQHRFKDAVEADAEEAVSSFCQRILGRFREEMDDDFNTPDAITSLFGLVHEANQYLQGNRVTRGSLETLQNTFRQINDVLGVFEESGGELLDEEIEQLIRERTEARKAKNWARADEIRDLLKQKGILLEDTPQGVRWRRSGGTT